MYPHTRSVLAGERHCNAREFARISSREEISRNFLASTSGRAWQFGEYGRRSFCRTYAQVSSSLGTGEEQLRPMNGLGCKARLLFARDPETLGWVYAQACLARTPAAECIVPTAWMP